MKKLIVFCLLSLLFVLSSCRTQKNIQYIDRVSYIDRLKVDSVYLSKTDSIYIEKRNDTVFIEKYRTLFRDKYRIEKDTVIKHDSLIFKSVETKKVKVEKELTWWQETQIAAGTLFFCILIALIGYIIVKYWLLNKIN